MSSDLTMIMPRGVIVWPTHDLDAYPRATAEQSREAFRAWRDITTPPSRAGFERLLAALRRL